MDVTVGIVRAQREVTLEMEAEPADIEERVNTTLQSGAPLRLQDDRDRVLLVPADKLAYVLIGSKEQRRVGFSI
ncbi:MAG: DUF3107 domain-containing protein [Bowdeniella nasicola]|nr:DUF3107 domain-containing protein [Bowdeniella nasicola]